jgi:small GTP-binding protein
MEKINPETELLEDFMDVGGSPSPGITLKHVLKGHTDTINRIAWSPDGKLLASPSEDNSIRIWDSETGECLKIIAETVPDAKWSLDKGKWMKNTDRIVIEVRSVEWSPDEKMFAYGSIDGSVHIMDTKTWQKIVVLHVQEYGINSLAWSPDGRYLASGSGDENNVVCVWNVKNWKLVNKVASSYKLYQGPCGCLAWSPDSKVLAFASLDELYIIDPITSGIEHVFSHSEWVYSITWLNNSLICSADDEIIRIWNIKTNKLIKSFEGHTDLINCLSYVHNDSFSLLASKSLDNTVRLWNTKTWDPILILSEKSDESGPFYAGLSFQSHNPYLATLGKEDTVIRIWELNVGLLIKNAQKKRYIRYTNAKVTLVGNSSTGKTCLARALMGKSFKPQESTHGMKVWYFHSEIIEIDGSYINRDIFLWDLAGQPDYQLIHQLFLDESSLGIILFDPTDVDKPFAGVGYWKNALEKVLRDDCPLILVAGRVDLGHSTVTLDDINEFCILNKFECFIETSSKSGQGIIELKEAIKNEIHWERLPVTNSPESWSDIRRYLLERRNGVDVLTKRLDLFEAFKRGYSKSRLNENEFNTVIRHTQSQGLIWKLSFGDFILLKPEILNDYASAIVHVARNHPSGIGSVAEIDILNSEIDFGGMERINFDSERLLLHAVVELLIDREIALREGEYLVFPSKFNRKWPELTESPNIEVIYNFEGPIEDIYSSLIVRVFYSSIFKLKDLWRNGAEFYDHSDSICGIMLSNHEGKGIISIFFEKSVSIDIRVLFSKFIHEHLEKKAISESVTKEKIYNCSKCNEKVEDKRAINFRLENGERDIICQYCNNSIQLDILEEKFVDKKLPSKLKELNEVVTEKKGEAIDIITIKAKKEIDEFDVFLAYNNEDKDDVETIANALVLRGINPWFDKWNLPPGRLNQTEIFDKVLPLIKSVAVIVGKSGIGPWENMEMRVAITQFIERKCPVIPILLPDVSNNPELPTLLKELGWVKFTDGIHDINAIDKIEWCITGFHPRRKSK